MWRLDGSDCVTGVHFWPWPDQYISRNSQDFRRRQSCRHGRQGGRRRPPRALLRRPPGQGAHAEKVPEYSNFPYLPFSTIPCFSMVWCCYFLGGVGWVGRRSLRRREGRDEEGEIGNPPPPLCCSSHCTSPGKMVRGLPSTFASPVAHLLPPGAI